ncbi:hypothetical protein LPJ71_000076, partial [Coemansia sp. S17]
MSWLSATNQQLEYSLADDVEANADDDETTPLARRADQKPVPLRILRSIEVLGGGSSGRDQNLPAEKSIRGAYLDAFGLLFFTLAASTLSNQTLWVGRHIGFRIKGLLVAELSSKTLRRRGKGSWEDAKSADDKEKDEDEDDAAPTAQAAADVQDLENRVVNADSGSDELGFVGADLEWDSPSSNSKSDGKDLTGVETPDVTENTPLLADSTAAATPHSQLALSPVNESYASLDRDDGSSKRHSSSDDDDLTPLMLGRTRVLVTHHVSMCLPFAQYIVMLREGQVSLKGNPAELQDQGVFTKVLAELESSEDKEDDVDAKGKDAEQAKLTADVLDEEDPSKSVNDSTSEDEYNLRRLKKIAEQRGLDPDGDLSALQGTLVEDEERESGYVKYDVWLTYLNASGSKWFWIISFTLLTVCQFSLVMQDYWIRIWVASTSNDDALVGENMSTAALTSAVVPGSLWSALSAPLVALRASMPIYNLNSGLPGTLSATLSREQQHHSAIYWISIYVVIGVVSVMWRVIQIARARSPLLVLRL